MHLQQCFGLLGFRRIRARASRAQRTIGTDRPERHLVVTIPHGRVGPLDHGEGAGAIWIGCFVCALIIFRLFLDDSLGLLARRVQFQQTLMTDFSTQATFMYKHLSRENRQTFRKGLFARVIKISQWARSHILTANRANHGKRWMTINKRIVTAFFP